ncbi:hypothetical protein D7Y13_18300 [Corallococcus praedator]|uniref:Uncharacterized protein n=1 Tax=Corallococcus praedator TaxID=2316724 RepID=A0ABX9QGJ3_9BACT|nr:MULTISPECIES: hypothetical protein [Corallococcus]RKH10752.1 hypothetical protein D7X74_26885 [Corallococcus sp. CA047B]RKH25817.1 hypothetical protein D7X75_29365 [Corallococcus sp. CA031C]RKI07299.1 hypothetical protein D7Y13_18300 [Corallococcus praedator]
MSNPNPDPRVPAEMPPAAPEELTKKREGIISGLDAASKGATGTLQQVLRKMSELLVNTKDGAHMNMALYQDVKDAFNRHLGEAGKNPALATMPPVLIEAVEWMQNYLTSRGFEPSAAAPAAAAAPAQVAKPAAAAGQAGPKDAFVSDSAAKKRAAITGDVPPPPSIANAPPPSTQEVQKDLESFKAWMKNPALGKLKG